MSKRGMANDGTCIDSIIATVHIHILDSRSYYYHRYPGINIKYSHTQFIHTVPLGDILNRSPTFVAGFSESMLLTWVGLECRVHRPIDASYTVCIKVVDGPNPYKHCHREIFTYVTVPPPVSRYEPEFVRHILTSDKIDTGQSVHARVHKGFNIELLTSFSTSRNDQCSLVDTKVVLKVQHPSRVGGAYDHSTWDTESTDRTFNGKKIKAFVAFEKYVLKGDNALYY